MAHCRSTEIQTSRQQAELNEMKLIGHGYVSVLRFKNIRTQIQDGGNVRSKGLGPHTMSHCVTCLLERLMQWWSAWGTDLAPGGGGRCLLWWEVHTWASGFSSSTWTLWGGQYSGELIWESATRRQGPLNVLQAYVEMLKALTTFRMEKRKAGRGCHIVWLLLPREWPYRMHDIRTRV